MHICMFMLRTLNIAHERVRMATEVARALKARKLYIIPRNADPRHSGGHLEDVKTREEAQTVFVSLLGFREGKQFPSGRITCGSDKRRRIFQGSAGKIFAVYLPYTCGSG